MIGTFKKSLGNVLKNFDKILGKQGKNEYNFRKKLVHFEEKVSAVLEKTRKYFFLI